MQPHSSPVRLLSPLPVILIAQGSRLDDQRCAPPPPPSKGPTVPDEDFFSLIMRSQAKRMDEQRVTLPASASCHQL